MIGGNEMTKMTIGKAIEIQTQYLKQKETHISNDLDDAIRLSTEAMKRIEHYRADYFSLADDLLPGETTE